MSDSDFSEIDIAGHSAAVEPAVALREALAELAAKLAAAGGGPHHMTSMAWTAPDRAAFDPTRHELDLCYRETFGGFRPPISVVASSSGRFTVQVRARIPKSLAAEPVWHGFSRAELARQYSPRGQVASMASLFAHWSAEGAAFLQGRIDIDIAYGPTVFERLDVYRPDRVGVVPLWVFIHGGYWQASDKNQHGQFAAGMLEAGFAVANVNYGLCPDVPLSGIVAQIRSALRFLAGNAERFGIASDAMHVAGHSAGGHLSAMMAVDGDIPQLRSALLISGLFDLTPLALLPVGRIMGLSTTEDVAELSPVMRRPRTGTKIAIAVGGGESDEFKWQSAELARRWDVAPPLVVDDANHFAVLDGLIAGQLLDCAKRIAG